MVTPDEIIRSKRRTLSISVDARGRLIVRAPKNCEEGRILAFLREKESWILKKQAARRAAAIPLPTDDLNGFTFPLLGQSTKIILVDGKKIGYDKDNHVVYLPSDKPKERLVKWLKENAKRIFTLVTEEKAKEMGVSYLSVSVTSAKTRWGSCSGKNAIRYTFRLLYCPKEIIEYVVVHELSHIRHKDHSAAFWAEVDRYIVDRKRKRKWLKSQGTLMELF